MKSKMMSLVCLVACLLSTTLWAQPITIWSENFQNDAYLRWVNPGTWEIGIADLSFEGTSVLATVLNGDYANNLNSRITSLPISLPANAQNLRLTGYTWHLLDGTTANPDKVTVQVSIAGSNVWQDLATFTNSGSGAWSRFAVNLQAFAGQNILIGFLMTSDWAGTATGIYIDDLKILAGDYQVNASEGWENGIGDWRVENGTWEVGVPTGGTVLPHTGSRFVKTVLNGNYSDKMQARLVSPPFIVSSQQPQWRFWQKYALDATTSDPDKGYCQIREFGTTNWITVGNVISNTSSGVWAFVQINLSAYVGRTVEVSYFVVSDWAGTNYGWAIDDITLPIATSVSCLTATTTIQKNNISCLGNANGTATVTVSGGTPPYTYQWGNGGTTATISGLTAGLYPVTISGGGVCTKTDSVRIVEPTAINPLLTKNPSSCGNPNGGNIQLTPTGGTPPYAYRWSDGSTASNRTNLGGGNYAFTVTDANNCTASSSVSFPSTPSVSATISGNTTVPIGGTTVLTASGGGTYLWSTGATTPSITVGAGNYSVTASNGTCSAVATRTITVQSPLSGDTLSVACSADSFYLPILLTRDVLSANGGGLIHIFFDATKIRPTGFVRLGRIVPSASGYFIDTTNSVASIGIFLTGAAGITGVVGDTLAYVAFKIQPNFKQPNARLMLQTDVTLEWLNGTNQQAFTQKYIGLTGSILRLDIVKTSVGTPLVLRNGVSVRYGNGCTATSSDKIVALNSAGVSMSESGFSKIQISPMVIRQVAGLPQIGGQDAHLAFLISLRNAAYRPTITALIAADVDGSGAITISDVTQIQRRSIGDLRGFFRQNSTNVAHYVFFNKKELITEGYQISANYPLANGNQAHAGLVPKIDTCQNLPVIQASCDTIKEEWVAVLLGDIDNTYLTVGQIERLGVSVHINFCKAQWLGNNEWLIPIQADETTTALDLVIQDFSPNLQWLGVVAADGTTINGRLMKIENTVYISSFSTTISGELANRNLFFIKVRSMNPSLTTGLFGTITAWHNGKAATVELTERNATCKTIANKNAATISVAPTLAHEAIWIQNPSDKPHNLLIVNALGQTVSHAVAQANDVTEVDITAFSDGLYFVKNTEGGEVVRFVKQ